MLGHGGRLLQAVAEYGIPREQWLDLSTGINPQSWPVPELPATAWQRLPEEEDGLQQAAQQYYGCETLLAVAGSQAAIQALPRLRARSTVAVPRIGYAEHAHAWQREGHELIYYGNHEIEALLDQVDVLVVINPNNPAGARLSVITLLEWRQRLARRGGLLVVDEAFMDTTPGDSLLSRCPLPGLLVLRSLGKFFGLAGLRVGFAAAEPDVLEMMRDYLGPWAVSGPARQVATQALLDVSWQEQNRRYLRERGQRLAMLMETGFGVPSTGTALFQTVFLDREQAMSMYRSLAEQGVLVRLLDGGEGIRCGLPPESGWDRLTRVLGELQANAGTASSGFRGG